MLDRLAHVERLKRLLSAVNVFQKSLEDEILRAQADASETGMATYATLRRAAKARPVIAAELAPIKAWFRGTRKAAAGSAQPADTASGTTGASNPADVKPPQA